MIHKTRIEILNSASPRKGKFVVYWMQQSQRARYNHALEYAIESANELNLPVVVYFALTEFPEANKRHYWFMLQGLNDTRRALQLRGIQMVISRISPEKGIVSFANDASLVVVDMGYLRIQREWRDKAAQKLNCPLIQVESDVIVPVREASDKQEYSAGTLRPKLIRKLKEYLVPLQERILLKKSLKLKFDTLDISDITKTIDTLDIDITVPPIDWLEGGTTAAEGRLSDFIAAKLDYFATLRNDPSKDFCSHLSPYLHFGQISTLYVALEIERSKGIGKAAFLEEMIIRRELSMNFVWYNEQYDTYEAIPAWAQKSLSMHKKDIRKPLYTMQELEYAKTYDRYWNAAQKEMMIRGKMHGYMRMYWGKKILEWTSDPQEAFRTALYLNNKYELDGRDANGFTGVAWCFGKHDRAWKERPVFGKVRYMNSKGLERKFDIDAYVGKVEKYTVKQ